MSFRITCAGADAASVSLHVPGTGPWFADCRLLEAEGAEPSGRVELVIGDVTLSGTVDPDHSGTFGEQRSVRVIAGAAGWGRHLSALNYSRNDAGIKKSRIAGDAATLVGEVMAAPLSGNVGSHYVRAAGAASRVLDDLSPGAWWVDYSGLTQTGKRFTVPAGGGATVLEYDTSTNRVTCVVDTLNDLPIGAQLTDATRWAGTLTVAALEIAITAETFRVIAWCGTGSDAINDNLKALITCLSDGKLLGSYRYRVVGMSGEKVDLQAVRPAEGLPSILTVDMWPGLSGSHATLARGAECVVQFLDGRHDDPVVTNFIGRAGPDPDLIELGGKGGRGVARYGDAVTIPLPPAVLTGVVVINGTPSPLQGALVFPVGQVSGSITAASEKVQSA
jgi:hypothetical protein